MCAVQEQGRAGRQPAGARHEPSLLRAIVAAYGRPYFLLGLLKAAGDALNFAGPMLLNLLLRHLATPAGSAGGQGGPAGGSSLRLAGWQLDVASPAFGYACAALLAGSLVLKVGGRSGGETVGQAGCMYPSNIAQHVEHPAIPTVSLLQPNNLFLCCSC